VSRFSKGPEQQRLSPAERGNLVAYLDGELNEAESRAMATKLTQSPTARREVESLEKTWELLDFLPRPKAPENFTERTLSEVRQLEAKGGQFETAFVRTAQRLIRASLWVAASLLTFGLGFALTQWAWPNPTTRLVRDLSIAEHLNEYLDVGDFEFLKELADSPDFGTEPD
jgi:anti-sigma factor RsiW